MIRQQQALDRAAARYAGTEQARGKYLRVIDDEQVALAEELGELCHMRVLHAPRVSVKDEEFRRPALGRGSLRDEFRRQIEPEVGNVHRRKFRLTLG